MRTDSTSSSKVPRLPWWIAALVFAAAALFFLWEEHSVHILGAWPLLLVLGCLLMHFFMHGGHGGHRGQDGTGSEGPE